MNAPAVNAPVANAHAVNASVLNAMTVDVEDYFHVEAFAHVIDRADWASLPCRVEANTDRILAQFDTAGVKATLFTLGWVAERYPLLIRRIVAAGHELASHGYEHHRVDRQSPAEFAADIARARALLEDIGGVPVLGYRAPTFSISARTPWAYDALVAAGYRYSSSVYPVKHDLYGSPHASRFPEKVAGGALWELPMTTIELGARRIPCSGGGFFRLLPYAVYRQGLRRFNATEGRGGMFYTHPWEIDPGQPRVAAPARSRFRHYLNLDRTAPRPNRLLRDFAWGRVDQVYAAELMQVPA